MEAVARNEIRQKLREWQSGIISTDAIQTWASQWFLAEHIDFEDWEGDNSVSNEILGALDMLDMNLTTTEDADAFLEFLSSPVGQFAEGYKKMKVRLDSVDFDARRIALRGVEPYAPFLK